MKKSDIQRYWHGLKLGKYGKIGAIGEMRKHGKMVTKFWRGLALT